MGTLAEPQAELNEFMAVLHELTGREAGARVAKVRRVPLLASHRGAPPDLILRWNVATAPDVIDVVVHLHGYWHHGMQLDRDIERVSGLDLAPAGGRGRSRPTLTVLPKGHDTGVRQKIRRADGSTGDGPFNVFTFPRLVQKDGLTRLLRFALDRFATEVGGRAPRMGRLILTAHSGGGAALLQILKFHDPHQVHVFDALYQDAEPLRAWACRRIRCDRAALRSIAGAAARDYMSTRGGALRVFYQDRTRGGTRPNSLALRRALAAELGPEVESWYRVEASKYDHFQIPSRYGWRLLADAAADVPDAHSEPVTQHELAVESETGGTVTFPSGATLRIVSGPIGPGEEHHDPHNTGNPLLDTGASVRSTLLSRCFTVGELTRSGVHFDKARIDPKLVGCLQKLWDHIGRSVTIDSSYRPYRYNEKLYRERYKRTPTKSRHSSGQAADIRIAGMTGMEIAKAALDVCGPNIGVGIADTYAHVDVRPAWGSWTYYPKGSDKERRALAEIRAYRSQCAKGGIGAGKPSPPTRRPAAAPTPPATAATGAAGFTRGTPERRRLAALVPLLNWSRGDIPLDFLLGWIDVESNGRIDQVTRLQERGFFQIHPDESKDQKFDHHRLSTDPAYSVRAGIQLVRRYADLARRRFTWVPPGSELFWRIVKLQHAMGSPLARTMLYEMRRGGVPPTSWQAIKSFELSAAAQKLHKLLRVEPGRFGRNVDAVFTHGQRIARSLAANPGE